MEPLTFKTDYYNFSPENMSDWNSHRPMLIYALEKAKLKGEIIEFGAGEGSTLMLKKICDEQGNKFTSYESDPEYGIGSSYLNLVRSYDDVNFEQCGILFIDNAPGERRKLDLLRFRDRAKVIIVHDTQPSAEYVYGMEGPLSTFKYRVTLKNSLGLPETTAVSMNHDVTKWSKTRVGNFWFE